MHFAAEHADLDLVRRLVGRQLLVVRASGDAGCHQQEQQYCRSERPRVQ